MRVEDRIVQQIPIVMRVLAISVWFGGLIVFRTLIQPNALPILGNSLRMFNMVALFCAGLMILSEIPTLRTKEIVSYVRLIFVIIAGGIMLDLQYGLILKDSLSLSHRYLNEAMYAVYALIPVLSLAGVESAPKRKRASSRRSMP
jgi:hypothetical protein